MERKKTEALETNASQTDIKKNCQENNPLEDKNTDLPLSKEIETDADGNQMVVDRARNPIESPEEIPNEIKLDNPNANRGVTTDKEAMKTVENKDLNSDVTPNRYPASHPDNHKDRGNMKLDE
ncbi:hypothetical protein [Flavobacterium sp. UMI-01]|uniref:hypothetical protein n=1 Tax=Flavobacterium sp. UMI-01 TaxID=1441053 RepID=UPI001C7CB2DE|nr:hypothetical protein [Flavobacterium sp. UMI-01]GIZ08296.1 hypothetical protein FUMI01_10230 [Flavobacterium sp. UMI-01]